MKSAFAYLLASLVLLQTFSRELVVADFYANRVAITQQFCVNKARPMLHCDGKCYFAKQLKQQQERESKAPNPLRERLEMLPQAPASLVPPRPAAYPAVATRYHRAPAPNLPRLGLRAIFRPPQRG